MGWTNQNPTAKQRRQESKPYNSIPFHSGGVVGERLKNPKWEGPGIKSKDSQLPLLNYFV